MRQAIAAMMERRYGLKFNPDGEITVTCGVTEALSVIFMSLLDPGDEVIVIEPFHEGYLPQVKFAGGVPVFVPLEEPSYLLQAERVREAITPRTKAIMLNTPARVATIEESRMSRFRIWESSCPSTPESSSILRSPTIPCVSAIAACLELRPAVKTFAEAEGSI